MGVHTSGDPFSDQDVCLDELDSGMHAPSFPMTARRYRLGNEQCSGRTKRQRSCHCHVSPQLQLRAQFVGSSQRVVLSM